MIKRSYGLLILICAALASASPQPQPLPHADPETVGLSAKKLEQVRPLLQEAIDKNHIPGAVILVARKGRVVLREALGHAQVVPKKVAMKADMVFDLASITKPMATAVSMMILVEKGVVRLQDRVRDFVPQFSRFINDSGEESPDARIYHLLTHTAGLLPYTDADRLVKKLGYACPIDSAASYIGQLNKSNAAGEAFHYSCLGFITQANIIQQVTGLTLHDFSQKHVFQPLGMKHTGFIEQIAGATPDPNNPLIRKYGQLLVPTEMNQGKPFLGTVHDPLARALGGLSGNAGLFSNVDDMAIFAQMMLNGGEYGGVRILSPLTVKKMTAVYPATQDMGRGLGWDIASAYSSNGGDLFPAGGYGHTGYTGTSLWINPPTETFVILLTNRVHPKDANGAAVVRLRSRVANVVASAIMD